MHLVDAPTDCKNTMGHKAAGASMGHTAVHSTTESDYIHGSARYIGDGKHEMPTQQKGEGKGELAWCLRLSTGNAVRGTTRANSFTGASHQFHIQHGVKVSGSTSQQQSNNEQLLEHASALFVFLFENTGLESNTVHRVDTNIRAIVSLPHILHALHLVVALHCLARTIFCHRV